MRLRRHSVVWLLGGLALFASGSALAAANNDVQLSLNTIWLVLTGALVFFMQAGFALVESGMARAKNAVNVIMKNYTDMCFGAIAFWLVGYGLMFGSNPSGWFGTDHFFLGNAQHMDYSLLFFQSMFAATAATIASGAMAERTHYWGYILGSTLITAFIYAIFGSWAWGSLYQGSGWLKELGFVDFAGSSVVHAIGGWCALAGIIIVGPRLGRFGPHGELRYIAGHNLTSVALGGFILWLGWFGFNGGSAINASPDVGRIVLNTHFGGAAGAIGAMITLLLLRQSVLMTTTVNGSIAGLVSITAGCATMEPLFAILTGLLAGSLMIISERVMQQLRLDDVVGAVPVHAVCGSWGTLAAGLFYHGDLFNLHRIGIQLLGVVSAFLWAFPLALAMYYLINRTIGLRAHGLAEQRGLDYSEHAESGYPEFQHDLLHDNLT